MIASNSPQDQLKLIHLEVLSLIARDYTLADIGQTLQYSYSHIHRSAEDLKHLFGVRTLTALTARGIKDGYIDADGNILLPISSRFCRAS